MRFPRDGGGCAALPDERVVAVGGCGGGRYQPTCEALDLRAGKWEALPDLEQARRRSAATRPYMPLPLHPTSALSPARCVVSFRFVFRFAALFSFHRPGAALRRACSDSAAARARCAAPAQGVSRAPGHGARRAWRGAPWGA